MGARPAQRAIRLALLEVMENLGEKLTVEEVSSAQLGMTCDENSVG